MGISRAQALDCLRSDDLIGIGMEADAVRRKLHPEGVASYVVERRIGCAGIAKIGEGEAGFEAVCGEVGETLEMGGTGVVLLGLASSRRNVDWFEDLFAGIKRRHPAIWLQGLNAPEVRAISEGSELSVVDVLRRLGDVGLDSICGDGMDGDAENSLGNGGDMDVWAVVHRAAHGLGMSTAAAMVFGGGETMEQRVDRLEIIYKLQEETGGFSAFVPVSFHAANGRSLDDATAVEGLKMLAVSRMVLDNIENVEWHGASDGLKVRQMGLRFGGNDVGSATQPEGRTGSIGDASDASEEDLRRIIRDAGLIPVQRDMPYRTLFLS